MIFSGPQHVAAFRWVVVVLVLAAGATFLPLWPPLVLAVWLAQLARPLLRRLAATMGGKQDRAAGALVVIFVTAMFLPLLAAGISLTRGAIDLARSLLGSGGAKEALIRVASGGGGEATGESLFEALKSPQKIAALVQEYGGHAVDILGNIAGAATGAALGLFIFIYAFYVALIDGSKMYEWMENHSPLELLHTRRLADAFTETGRGLLVGVGLTGLAQGVVATITYFALGVPRALVLGMLTCFASLIPSVGTALVWVPVAIGLALAGKTGAAIAMAVIGVVVIGTIDNVLRPVFARFGDLALPNFVLLTSIFGGLAAFGAGGLLLGPLFTRLAKEALMLARTDREREAEVLASLPPPSVSLPPRLEP